MANEGLIDRATAVQRVEPAQLDQLLHPMIDPKAAVSVLATGLPASPGAAVGQVVFDADEAQARGEAGDKVILVRVETSPLAVVLRVTDDGVFDAASSTGGTGGTGAHFGMRAMHAAVAQVGGTLRVEPASPSGT